MQGTHVEEKPGFVFVEDLCGIDGDGGIGEEAGWRDDDRSGEHEHERGV